MKKIGILGAHGTGKTTLAYEMAAFVKKKCSVNRIGKEMRVGLLSEVVRSCPIQKEKNIEAFRCGYFMNR